MTIPLWILVLFLAWLVTFAWSRLSTRRGARRLLRDFEILHHDGGAVASVVVANGTC